MKQAAISCQGHQFVCKLHTSSHNLSNCLIVGFSWCNTACFMQYAEGFSFAFCLLHIEKQHHAELYASAQHMQQAAISWQGQHLVWTLHRSSHTLSDCVFVALSWCVTSCFMQCAEEFSFACCLIHSKKHHADQCSSEHRMKQDAISCQGPTLA